MRSITPGPMKQIFALAFFFFLANRQHSITSSPKALLCKRRTSPANNDTCGGLAGIKGGQQDPCSGLGRVPVCAVNNADGMVANPLWISLGQSALIAALSMVDYVKLPSPGIKHKHTSTTPSCTIAYRKHPRQRAEHQRRRVVKAFEASSLNLELNN